MINPDDGQWLTYREAAVVLGLTPEGVRYDNDYCLVFRLEDGKIKEIREYCDSVLTEKALGPFPQTPVRAAS